MDEITLYVAGIISLIILIVFFVMASNLGAIKKDLRQLKTYIGTNFGDLDYLGKKELQNGNKEKALEHFQDLLFALMEEKIKCLPGYTPSESKDYILRMISKCKVIS